MFKSIKRNKTFIAGVSGAIIGAAVVYNYYHSKTFLEIPEGGLERLRRYDGAFVFGLPGGDLIVRAVKETT
jgi:hypothetical protein